MTLLPIKRRRSYTFRSHIELQISREVKCELRGDEEFWVKFSKSRQKKWFPILRIHGRGLGPVWIRSGLPPVHALRECSKNSIENIILILLFFNHQQNSGNFVITKNRNVKCIWCAWEHLFFFERGPSKILNFRFHVEFKIFVQVPIWKRRGNLECTFVYGTSIFISFCLFLTLSQYY